LPPKAKSLEFYLRGWYGKSTIPLWIRWFKTTSL
jgi:hypothetical protein